MPLQMPTKKTKPLLYLALAVLATLVAIAIYGLWIEPNQFVVTRQTVTPAQTEQTATLKLVQISDLHLKQFNQRAEQVAVKINQLKPDLIVLTGDILDKAEQLPGVERFLDRLPAATPTYSILGNWEYWSGVDLEQLKQVYANHNIRLLVNATAVHRFGEQKILISGIDDLVNQPNLSKALQGIKPQLNHLLLAHAPAYRDSFSADEIKLLDTYKPQLMLSGHTHGGQIVLGSWVPLRPPGSGKYVSGWYRQGIVPLYVSRGLGASVLPFRLGAVPEISYFEWPLSKSSI